MSSSGVTALVDEPVIFTSFQYKVSMLVIDIAILFLTLYNLNCSILTIRKSKPSKLDKVYFLHCVCWLFWIVVEFVTNNYTFTDPLMEMIFYFNLFNLTNIMGIYLYQVVTILRIFQIRQSLVSRVKSHVVSNLYSKSLAMILLLTTAFNFVPLTIDFMFKYCKYVWQIKGLQEPSYCAVPMFKTGTIDSIAWMLQIGTIPIIESVLAFMLVGSLVTLKKHEKKEKALKENEKEDEFHFSATASDKQKQNNNSKKIKNILRNVLMWITITWVAALLNIFTVFYVFHPKFSSDNDSNYNIAWVIQQFSYFMTTIEFSLFNIWRNKKFKDNTNTPKAANIKDKKRVSKTAVEVEDF